MRTVYVLLAALLIFCAAPAGARNLPVGIDKAAAALDGYALEAAIPFEPIRLKPESGRIIGLNVMADDSDANHRQHVMMTRGENLLYWRSPASTGDLRLK